MKNSFNRRHFIKGTTSAALLRSRHVLGLGSGVSIAIDPADKTAAQGPAAWAADRLEKTLSARGVSVSRCVRPNDAKQGDFCIVSSSFDSPISRNALKSADLAAHKVPEALALA